MRVLVIAPQPFYLQRGTPMAVDMLLTILSEKGITVDLLTFRGGQDKQYPGVTIYRSFSPFDLSDLPPGFSFRKICADIFLSLSAFFMLFRNKYDLLHCVEEAAFIGLFARVVFRKRFIYDMDSLLSQQIVDKFPAARCVSGFLRFMESLLLRYAVAVAPMCKAIADEARMLGAKNITLVQDISFFDASIGAPDVVDIKKTHAIGSPVIMYTGNLASYQGIDLLLESFGCLLNDVPAQLVVIGGRADDIVSYKQKSAVLNIDKHVLFLGEKPLAHMSGYIRQADVLVSPRIQGVNTPLKIFTYLHSGIPVVATDILSHTQVLTPDIAVLARPSKTEFAKALLRAINDEEYAQRIGKRAQEFIEREHTYPHLRDQVLAIYGSLTT